MSDLRSVTGEQLVRPSIYSALAERTIDGYVRFLQGVKTGTGTFEMYNARVL